MEDVITRIKDFAIILNPDLEDIDADLFDFIVNNVVNRALTYMNRRQLVADYEEDIVDYPITDKSDTTEAWYTFWKNYEYPIPADIERVLASVIVDVHKEIVNKQSNSGTNRAVKSISDQGQSITYSDSATNFLNSVSDSEVFSGAIESLNKFRLGTV